MTQNIYIYIEAIDKRFKNTKMHMKNVLFWLPTVKMFDKKGIFSIESK